MTEQEMHEIYLFNNERRSFLLSKALEKPTPFEQMKYVVDYFTNTLPAEEIMSIDDTENVIQFCYDYSYLEDYNATFGRMQFCRAYKQDTFGITLPMAITDIRQRDLRIYPTIFALKLATCRMFASEIARFAMDFGIECKIENEITPCYDNFFGMNQALQHTYIDRVIDMNHYYNTIIIDGQKLKIDISGILTGIDFNTNHPECPIDVSEFYFSQHTTSNPFKNIMLTPIEITTDPETSIDSNSLDLNIASKIRI